MKTKTVLVFEADTNIKYQNKIGDLLDPGNTQDDKKALCNELTSMIKADIKRAFALGLKSRECNND